MSHDETTRRVFGISLETVVARILRTFDKASASDVESGVHWYDEAGTLASDLAATTGHSRDVCAAVISHLSPRQFWARNVASATAILSGDDAYPGIMGRELSRALSARDDGWDDLAESFNGPKTRRFYLNIIGDREAVTVDVWACRVADLDETALGRKGAYEAVEHAYRLAARRRGVDPSTMQATTWIVARNGRAS